MRSHSYHLKIIDWINFVVAPLFFYICITLFGGFICTKLAPGPAQSIEGIIIQEKASAGDVRSAQTLFVGDSSCLMDFSARQLEELLPDSHFYNLGTLSTLGLIKFGQFT